MRSPRPRHVSLYFFCHSSLFLSQTSLNSLNLVPQEIIFYQRCTNPLSSVLIRLRYLNWISVDSDTSAVFFLDVYIIHFISNSNSISSNSNSVWKACVDCVKELV